MRFVQEESVKPSFWQTVFSQSKVNGAPYTGEQLPGSVWDWPKDTYLQRRLRHAKWHRSSNRADLN